MHTLTVRLNEKEYALLKEYSINHSRSMSNVLKDAFFDKLEDEFDIEIFNESYNEYLKDTKTFSHDEVKRIIGI